MKLANPFRRPGKWYRANLHTHTTTSDGAQSPADTAAAYRSAGYDILALTDHHRTNDLTGLGDKRFLVINGLEYHPRCRETDNPHHFVALNVPRGFGFEEPYPPDAAACIAAVRRAGGESILAHPLWCGHRYDMYAYLDGFVALEVFNGTCDRIGRAFSEADWCHLNDAARLLPAVAVDDSHGLVDRFRGWTWLKLTRLTPQAVVEAVRAGCGYASTGPRIHDFRVEKGRVTVTCSDAAVIYLIAHSWRGARREAQRGRHIRKFSRPIGQDWRYVRAVVVDGAGRKAWTNPLPV